MKYVDDGSAHLTPGTKQLNSNLGFPKVWALDQQHVCPSLAPRGLSPKTPKPGKPSEEECVPSHAIGHTPTLGCQTTGQLDPELLQDPGPQGGRLLKGTCARSSVAGKPSPFTHPVLPPGHKSPEDRTQLLRRQRLCAPPSSDWATAHQGPLPAPPPGGPGEGPGELKAQRSQAGQVGAENTSRALLQRAPTPSGLTGRPGPGRCIRMRVPGRGWHTERVMEEEDREASAFSHGEGTLAAPALQLSTR